MPTGDATSRTEKGIAKRAAKAKAKKAGGKREHAASPDLEIGNSPGRRNSFSKRDSDISLEEQEEEEGLNAWDPRGCLLLTKLRCGRCCRRMCRGLTEQARAEWDDVILNTKTASALVAIKKMKRDDIRKAMFAWFRGQWQMLFGQARQATMGKKSKKYKGSESVISKASVEGGFGISSFIIHNAGDIHDYFEMHEAKEIGAGGASKVYRCREHATRVERAIKCIFKKHSDPAQLGKEVEIMKGLDHPNIAKLYETFEDDRHLYLIVELCFGGDLLDLLLERSLLQEIQVAVIIRTLLMVVNYLHANSIVHRDIKPENVLFREARYEDSTSIRLVDFGFACKNGQQGEKMTTKVGSPYYMAPEVLDGEYTSLCDCWSLGAVTYLLLCGYPPFSGETDAAVLNAVRQGKFLFHRKAWHEHSQGCKHLIKHLLTVDQEERYRVVDALDHPWIKNRGRTGVERIRPETVDRLINFHHHHKLRKAAMLALAYQMEARELAQVRELFHQLDLNGDGIVTRNEFEISVKGCGVDENFISEMLPSVDADGSGIIDYTEFVAATLETEMYRTNHAACFRAFRSFDQDDSGGLSQEEVAETLDMGNPEDEVEVAEFFKEVDLDGDGLMDYGEFHVMLVRELDPNAGLEFEAEDGAEAFAAGGLEGEIEEGLGSEGGESEMAVEEAEEEETDQDGEVGESSESASDEKADEEEAENGKNGEDKADDGKDKTAEKEFVVQGSKHPRRRPPRLSDSVVGTDSKLHSSSMGSSGDVTGLQASSSGDPHPSASDLESGDQAQAGSSIRFTVNSSGAEMSNTGLSGQTSKGKKNGSDLKQVKE